MKFSLFSCAIALGATSVVAAVDFTAGTSERKLDGIVFKQLVFHQNGKPVTYEQPRKWEYSSDSRSLRLTPDTSQAQAVIEQETLAAPLTFDEPTVKKLQEKVAASVPQGATKVEIVSVEKNPFMINAHETLQVIVTYTAFAQEFQSAVIFVNMPDTLLHCRCTARKAEFDKVNKQFRGSLFSFQGL